MYFIFVYSSLISFLLRILLFFTVFFFYNNVQTKLEFTAPENPGDYNMILYLMSDSYLGCDQEYEIPLTVLPDEGGDGADDDDDDDEKA